MYRWALPRNQRAAPKPVSVPTDEKSAAPPDPSAADNAAIRAGSEAFVAAFNEGDAKAVAALWTEHGEYIDDSGRTIAGRDAIEKDYAAFFAENPDVKIQIAIDSLRVLSGEVAIEDGRASRRSGSARRTGSQQVHRRPRQGRWKVVDGFGA